MNRLYKLKIITYFVMIFSIVIQYRDDFDFINIPSIVLLFFIIFSETLNFNKQLRQKIIFINKCFTILIIVSIMAVKIDIYNISVWKYRDFLSWNRYTISMFLLIISGITNIYLNSKNIDE